MYLFLLHLKKSRKKNFLHHLSHFMWHFLSISYKQTKIPIISKFLSWKFTKSQVNNSLMVVHLQILDYSMTMDQAIHCFEKDLSWLLDLLLKLLLLKWLICGNDYITFYKNMEQKIMVICKRLCKSKKSCYFTDLVISVICSMTRRFCTYLDYVYVYKDSPKIYVQHICQW